MKVTTDSSLFGAWLTEEIFSEHLLKKDPTLLDIGAGTGLLSIMAAQKLRIRIEAVEIDARTAEQASFNIDHCKWRESIRVIHQDILQFTPDHKYDFIISNPPFYERELLSPDEGKNRAHHGSYLLLSDLFHFIRENLDQDGRFFLLLPYKREKEIESLLEAESLYIHKKILVRPGIKHAPSRIMITGKSRTPEYPSFGEIIVREQNDYSQEFIRLLKDYYLYL